MTVKALASDEAGRQLLVAPAVVNWMIWRKWEVFEIYAGMDATDGGCVDNRTATALSCIKADLIRFASATGATNERARHDRRSVCQRAYDKAYRILALAYGIEGLVDELDHGPAEHNNRVMAAQHLARSISEEAHAALETLEMAEMAARIHTVAQGV
jgi:hypothetical protein